MGKLTVKDGKKVCTKCKNIKNVAKFDFILDPRFGKKYISSKCKECSKLATYKWRVENRGKNLLIGQRHRDKLKLSVISKYGKGGKPICMICGFDDIRALCIDHILNNGAAERKSIKDKYFAGALFHRWLRENEYPKGYQVLCANCNLIKEIDRRRNGNNNTSQL